MQLSLELAPPLPQLDAPLGAIEAWVARAGHTPAFGVDEAGRGPLAGPVYAAAVCWPEGPLPCELLALDDSKALKARVRERLVGPIVRHALGYGVAFADARQIDELGIWNATRQAMLGALTKAERRAQLACRLLLVDGNLRIKEHAGAQLPLVKGDGRSFAIAAASVLAKVARDRRMCLLDMRYPGYGFLQHKGYGTALHLEAIRRLGPCDEHRRSFAGVCQ